MSPSPPVLSEVEGLHIATGIDVNCTGKDVAGAESACHEQNLFQPLLTADLGDLSPDTGLSQSESVADRHSRKNNLSIPNVGGRSRAGSITSYCSISGRPRSGTYTVSPASTGQAMSGAAPREYRISFPEEDW